MTLFSYISLSVTVLLCCTCYTCRQENNLPCSPQIWLWQQERCSWKKVRTVSLNTVLASLWWVNCFLFSIQLKIVNLKTILKSYLVVVDQINWVNDHSSVLRGSLQRRKIRRHLVFNCMIWDWKKKLGLYKIWL